MPKYNHKKVEAKWQKVWSTKKFFQAKDFAKKPKKYILVEFPYPSGAGLHMGHLRPYVAGDVYSRFHRMRGENVLFPMGWDAFGLPAENYAIKMGVHPAITTKKNISNAKKQMLSWGLSFDWSREINTTDPNYYKWTQWIFLQFYKAGLAYEATGLINWCPKDKTGLANEEVIDGRCERCGTVVEKKELRQWYLKITAYAEKLLEGLKNLPEWPEAVKLQQENWIGKSIGAEIDFILAQPPVKRFVILHGREGSSKKNFIPWLKKELESRGFEVQAPDLPNSKAPDDVEQTEFVKKNCTLDEQTVVIGHSFGGVVALRLLEQGIKVNRTILVSTPVSGKFLDDRHRPTVVAAIKKGFDFDAIKRNQACFSLLYDINDRVVPMSDGEGLEKQTGFGLFKAKSQHPHFTAEEEPEILNVALGAVKVFTTRPDTIFGATYLVMAPEHPVARAIALQVSNRDEVLAYIEAAKNKKEIDRTAEGKEKTGVELKGAYVINPATKQKIPIWVADYVLWGYGTGAIMAVPAHDERDFDFAKKYQLPIRPVVASNGNVVMVHGCPKDAASLIDIRTDSDEHWIPWVRKQLQATGVKVENPLMPEAWHPDYNAWKKEFEKLPIDENSILIGHSCGGTFLVRWLGDSKKKIRKLILVAPAFKSVDEALEEQKQWYGFDIDKDIKNRVGEVVVFIGHKDKDHHQESAKMYSQALHGRLVEFADKGHFMPADMGGTNVFPELLDEIQSANHATVAYGNLINSGEFTGMKSEEAIPKMAAAFGKLTVQYKLRDWVFSRQRYWGEPIPIIHCEKCGIVPVPDKDLPVKLPPVKKYEPTGTGESPLAAIKKWVNVKCPKCKLPAKRETNTMPQWAGSSWYWLRYTDPKDKKSFADKKKQAYWTPVDVYFGGMEHTTLHLLYSRFWNLFLYDQKLVTAKEPYKLRKPHGIILGPDGEKMSKSRGNVVNPQDIVDSHGADTLRMFELFLGPHGDTIAWKGDSIVGVKRFLDRVWDWANQIKDSRLKIKDSDKAERALHKLIKKITEDIQGFSFNTSIAAFMEFHNQVKDEQVSVNYIKTFLKLLYPFAPHMSEELNQLLGGKKSLQLETWPEFDPAKVIDETVEIVVQVNGRVKGKMTVARGATQESVQAESLKIEAIIQALAGQSTKRVVYVPNRLINFVV